jgi:hypothetical protein
MPSLRDYVTEAEQWAQAPREGDDLDIEIAPDELAEGRVIESDGEFVVLEISESAVAAMEQRGMLAERIGRYGAVGSSRAMGYTVAEEQPEAQSSDTNNDPIDEDFVSRMLELAGVVKPVEETAPIQPNLNAARTDPLAAKAADLAPVGTEKDPTTATTVDEGVMSGIDMDLRHIAKTGLEDALIDALGGKFGDKTADYLQNMMSEIEQELGARGQQSLVASQDRMLDIMMDRIQAMYDDEDLDDIDDIREAEYQGRKVPLGKPMRGDQKKFKVYVRDPKTGNVKKVNFGHGGKSAKRAGEKTLRIKKSNPARRRSFRARHNCDNPGPRTKARYWSCRAW